ncbi:hypothetical protein BCR35DRAFT_291559 [Leucosporidium creatinivorum]|uniref:DASH complex subunit ASK1 n=1 Tax=Leucosporidium creatinivorum TaxID=106004 RepID=A0A1Y2F720_9BASI|nr:hypothetical protein BCR35DRAFT_291559 [Leucosporidium creatinivorum]
MAHRRVYYDPSNPVMLRPDDIVRLSPSEIQAASDQIDQNMVVLLQKIEENFARCNQIVIERILPAVTQHGENSQRIYESVKFWKPFFEAAAAQRYSDQDTEVPEGDSGISENHLPQNDADASLSFADASQISGDVSQASEGTPQPPTSAHAAKGKAPAGQQPWSDDASQYDSLQADLDQLGLPAKYDANTSAATDSSKEIHRLRLGDLPPDSPDIPVPEWETINHTTRKPSYQEQPSPSLSAANSSLPFPTSTRPGAPPASNPALLHKILSKNFASPRPPGSSTPGRSNLPKGWNGLADLSQTPLSAFASPIKRQGAAADESGWDHDLALGSATRHLSSSPLPPNLSIQPSFSLGSPMPPSRTPAKEAARRMTQDVYDATTGFEDSPGLEPPSVMKEWATRNYASLMEDLPAPSPSEGRRKGFEEEQENFEGGEGEESFDADEAELQTLRMAALADYGGGTTAKIDDLLGEQSFARLVDDDEADRFGRLNLDEQEESYTMEAPEEHEYDHQQQHPEQSYVEEGISEDEVVGLAPPEDTFFGTKDGQQQQNRSLFDEDLTSPGQPNANGFRMMGAVDHTLHGGQLLESEPFESSPLQGRNRGEY